MALRYLFFSQRGVVMTDNLSSLSAQQLADVFGVAKSTLFSLVKRNGMPCLQKTGATRFDLSAVSDWLKSKPPIATRQDPLERAKEYFRLQFPDAIASIKTLDKEFAEKNGGKATAS
jgi:predicted DNA-binding transcriptional regulator AlpA